jgi:hypothetical protein
MITFNKLQEKTQNEERRTQNAVFSSNCIRLSTIEWIFVALAALMILSLTPVIWERVEKFEPGTDFRLPYESGNDYWQYNRYCRWEASRQDISVIGDSVIWGHYVSKDNTLSHYLNELTPDTQFANLGLDGIHPAAMEGLLRYYGKNITHQNVILHFNPLWISSPKQDLQGEKEFVFNHPDLVAQFFPRIPCYKASFSKRIAAVLRRTITLPNWVSHINITYFQSMSMPAWTLENPYRNPLSAVTFKLPGTDNYEQWEKSHQPKNISTDGYQWVMPDESLQWRCFLHTIQLLRERKNNVFVLVGPFNEHTLGQTNLVAYQTLKRQIELALNANNVNYYMPPVLPAEYYIDASHPTNEGYALLARQLTINESFKSFILNAGQN